MAINCWYTQFQCFRHTDLHHESFLPICRWTIYIIIYIYCMYIYTPLYIPYCKPLYIYHIVYHYTIYIYCIYIYHIVYHYIPYIYCIYTPLYIPYCTPLYIYTILYTIIYHIVSSNSNCLPSIFQFCLAHLTFMRLTHWCWRCLGRSHRKWARQEHWNSSFFFWGGVPFWETVMSPKVPSYPQVVRLIIENRR